MKARLASVSLTVSLLGCLVAASIVHGAPAGSSVPEPKPSKTDKPNQGKDRCDDGNSGRGKDDCPTPTPTATPSPPTTSTAVGFGIRKITPVGQPPGPWAEFFTPNPKTGVWGERFEDLDGDGCYDPHLKVALPPGVDPRGEPHVDNFWNHAGNAYDRGAISVDGVTIYGDPQSAGKWDGLFTTAGYGAICPKGVHDDTWARAVVFQEGDTTVALVSLDVVGFFNIEIERARRELNIRYPNLDIDELVVSSTHTHEGPDTMGLWAASLGAGFDGKYPTYQAFIRSQLIDAVNEAYQNLEPAFAKFVKTEHAVGINDLRTPFVRDPWLLAAQFLDADGSVIGTIVNWSNHPESLGWDYPYISSDFVFGARDTLEKEFGAPAVYFSGSVGGMQSPLGAEVPGFGRDQRSEERTYEIGRLLAVAAGDALAGAPTIGLDNVAIAKREFFMDADNNVLRAFNAAGTFDVPTYIGYESWGRADHIEGRYAGGAGTGFGTEMVRIDLGPAVFLTVPGELLPELEVGGFGRPDCAAADTGRPYEPIISDQYEQTYQFVLGLAQDELGYIVPGYDFWVQHAPANDSKGNGLLDIGTEATDPCGEGHYEETVSASSVMAPWVTCIAAELSGRDPWALAESTDHLHPEDSAQPEYAACSYANTHTEPYGLDADQDGEFGWDSRDQLGRYRHPLGYYYREDPHDH